jgi:hypothetical protein
MSKPKIRATILDISGIDRYEIIKSVMSRYNTAVEHGFFLEATALIESLICDRLESRLGELIKIPTELNTIGILLKKLNTKEIDPILKQIMNTQLQSWCGERNKTIHQAAKIELGKKKDFNEFIRMSEKTAKMGRKSFDEYNKQLQKIRRHKNKIIT